uniref:Uncharacterized protein MANES_15G089100 n=1 Tax=Rhizophora mucronata TaxID=61149 RepID=A0A2P2LD46_RHIMU
MSIKRLTRSLTRMLPSRLLTWKNLKMKLRISRRKFLFCHNAALHTLLSTMVPISTRQNCG